MFCLAVRKSFAEQPFCVSESFGYRGNLPMKWIIRISIKMLLSLFQQKLFRRTLLCFRKFQVMKKSVPKGGISRFPVKNLLRHSIEKLRTGTPLCLRKLLISEIFPNKKGGGSVRILRQKMIVSVSKILVGEPRSLSVTLSIKKNFAWEG